MATIESEPYQSWAIVAGFCNTYKITGPSFYWVKRVLAIDGLEVTETLTMIESNDTSPTACKKNMPVDTIASQLGVLTFRLDGVYADEKVTIVVGFDSHILSISASERGIDSIHKFLSSGVNTDVLIHLTSKLVWMGDCLAYNFDVDDPFDRWIKRIYELCHVEKVFIKSTDVKNLQVEYPTVYDTLSFLPMYLRIDGTRSGSRVSFLVSPKSYGITLIASRNSIDGVAEAFCNGG